MAEEVNFVLMYACKKYSMHNNQQTKITQIFAT